jgi:hypothetical protein
MHASVAKILNKTETAGYVPVLLQLEAHLAQSGVFTVYTFVARTGAATACRPTAFVLRRDHATSSKNWTGLPAVCLRIYYFTAI